MPREKEGYGASGFPWEVPQDSCQAGGQAHNPNLLTASCYHSSTLPAWESLSGFNTAPIVGQRLLASFRSMAGPPPRPPRRGGGGGGGGTVPGAGGHRAPDPRHVATTALPEARPAHHRPGHRRRAPVGAAGPPAGPPGTRVGTGPAQIGGGGHCCFVSLLVWGWLLFPPRFLMAPPFVCCCASFSSLFRLGMRFVCPFACAALESSAEIHQPICFGPEVFLSMTAGQGSLTAARRAGSPTGRRRLRFRFR